MVSTRVTIGKTPVNTYCRVQFYSPQTFHDMEVEKQIVYVHLDTPRAQVQGKGTHTNEEGAATASGRERSLLSVGLYVHTLF